MKVLTNLPFECFEARHNYQDVELVTYGPSHRTWVDGVLYPADVGFDSSQETIETLFARLPEGFRPDLVLIYWPDQDPIPVGLERCPVPVVGVMSDYNLTLPYVVGLWPFFDAWVVDRGGVDLFERLSFANVTAFCQYSFKAPTHHIYSDLRRDLDIGFVGNLNPDIQSERNGWLSRMRLLEQHGHRSVVACDIFGRDYGRFLNRCKIGFNRAVRKEMNLRAFEVPACGAVLLMEEDNLEVRDFFVPDEEVVLYNEHNFESVVASLLTDPTRLHRIADAGLRRVQDYRMSKRLNALLECFHGLKIIRPDATAFERSLGRGTAMLSSWAAPDAIADELTRAHELAPADPRPLNAVASLHKSRSTEPDLTRIAALLRHATELAPNHRMSARNLRALDADYPGPTDQRSASWQDVDGVVLERCYSTQAVRHSHQLAESILTNSPQNVVNGLEESLAQAR